MCIPVYAQEANTQVTVDLKNLDSVTRNKILDMMKEGEKGAAVVSAIQPDKIQTYTEFGKMIATTLKEICQILSVEVNQFIKTPVGLFCAFLIGFKILGGVVGIGLSCMFILFVGIPLNLLLIWYFFSYREIKIEGADKNPKVIRIRRYDFESSSDAKAGVGWALSISIVGQVITMIAMIANIG
jgi:hypothetical protein